MEKLSELRILDEHRYLVDSLKSDVEVLKKSVEERKERLKALNNDEVYLQGLLQGWNDAQENTIFYLKMHLSHIKEENNGSKPIRHEHVG